MHSKLIFSSIIYFQDAPQDEDEVYLIDWEADPQDDPMDWEADPQDDPMDWEADPQDDPMDWEADPQDDPMVDIPV